LRQQENTWQQLRFHFLYELIHASVPLGACATGDAWRKPLSKTQGKSCRAEFWKHSRFICSL
jgi:hypothetical protein